MAQTEVLTLRRMINRNRLTTLAPPHELIGNGGKAKNQNIMGHSGEEYSMQNQKDSIDKIMYDTAIDEFKELRAEFRARLDAQSKIQNFAIILLGAIIAYRKSIIDYNITMLFLLLSIIFFMITIYMHDHETMISYGNFYITRILIPKMNAILNRNGFETQYKVLEWDEYRYAICFQTPWRRLHQAFIALGRHAMSILPGVYCLWEFIEQTKKIDTREIILIVIDLSLLCIIIFSKVLVTRLYSTPTPQQEELPPTSPWDHAAVKSSNVSPLLVMNIVTLILYFLYYHGVFPIIYQKIVLLF